MCGWLNLEVEVEVEVKVEVKIKVEVEVAALISLNLCVQQVLITSSFYVVRSIRFSLYTLSHLFHTKTRFLRRRKFSGALNSKHEMKWLPACVDSWKLVCVCVCVCFFWPIIVVEVEWPSRTPWLTFPLPFFFL